MIVAPLSPGAATILRSRVKDRKRRWWTIIKLEGEEVGDILAHLLDLYPDWDGQIEVLRWPVLLVTRGSRTEDVLLFVFLRKDLVSPERLAEVLEDFAWLDVRSNGEDVTLFTAAFPRLLMNCLDELLKIGQETDN
jgi:hypothetical protein